MSMEKRAIDRYLCNDKFSDTILTIDGSTHVMVSVNFNHTGIAIYSHERIAEHRTCELGFQYSLPDKNLVAHQLPAMIRYRFETEVGHQYGIQFILDALDDQIKQLLVQIETQLATEQESSNRWS